MPALERPLEPAEAGRRHRRRARRAARRRNRRESFFVGTALAAFGLVAWGFQQEREWADELLGWWPLLLAWIGLGKMLAGRFSGGITLLTGGGLAFLHLQGLADLEYTWPLMLVAVGLTITLGALLGRGGPLDEAREILEAELTTEDEEETNHG